MGILDLIFSNRVDPLAYCDKISESQNSWARADVFIWKDLVLPVVNLFLKIVNQAFYFSSLRHHFGRKSDCGTLVSRINVENGIKLRFLLE
jgi:hypothetical protein